MRNSSSANKDYLFLSNITLVRQSNCSICNEKAKYVRSSPFASPVEAQNHRIEAGRADRIFRILESYPYAKHLEKMMRLKICMVILLIISLIGFAGESGADEIYSSNPHRPANIRGTVVIPDILRRWDPITVFFERNTGPAKGGPEDHPSRFISFSPEHPGVFEWLDARTLQFRPAEAWPPLTRFTWRTGGHESEIFTLMSAPIRSFPEHGATGLQPVEEISLVFPEPLDSEALKEMVRVEIRPLPAFAAFSSPVWLSGKDFSVRVFERQSRRDTAHYIIRLSEPIPAGHQATVHIRLLPEMNEENDTKNSFHRISFTTEEPFRALYMGCHGRELPVTVSGTVYDPESAIECSSTNRRLQIRFSASLEEMSPIIARNLVRFSPSVEELNFRASGRILEIMGRFEPETLYRMSIIPSTLHDESGRPLDIDRESAVYLHFPRLPEFLSTSAGHGIMEMKGPKQIPIEGRGFSQVDLRIHRIDPLDLSLWPFPERPVSVSESGPPPGPGEKPLIHTNPNRHPFAHEIAERISSLGSPSESAVINLPIGPDRGSAKFGLDLSPHLEKISGKDRPGTYLAGLRRLDSGHTRDWIRVQVTDLSLTTLESNDSVRFIVSSLSTGQPVRRARIKLEGAYDRDDPQNPGGRIRKWTTITDGITGNDGSFTWKAPGHSNRRYQLRRITVKAGDDILVLDPARPPNRFFNNHWHNDRNTWLQWALGPLQSRENREDILTHIYTERPVYRPEEKVHIQGYIRKRSEGVFNMISPDDPYIRIDGPGDLSLRYPVSISDSGSFYCIFDEKDIPAGAYTARLMDRNSRTYGTVSFRVEAYRVPGFEITLHGPDAVPSDRAFEVKLAARYYAGGQVSDRPLRWRVTRFPYNWTPPEMKGFHFSSDDRFSSRPSHAQSQRMDSEGRTDSEGAAVLNLDPSVEQTAHPQSYVIEATLTGKDDQTVTSVKRVHSLPPFVLGIKIPRVINLESSVNPEFLVADYNGKIISGKEVELRLSHRQWHAHLVAGDFSQGQARYQTEIVEEEIYRTNLTSGNKAETINLPIERAGVYVLELSAGDRLGRTQAVEVDFFATGDEPISWQRPEQGVFNVSPDKQVYEAGDTATLVLQSPFQSASAIAVIESPDALDYRWLDIRNGAATFQVPVSEYHAPRLPVHFILMRGRIRDSAPFPGTDIDPGRPQTVASTIYLNISESRHRVSVKLEHPKRAFPGEEIDIEVQLSDHEGLPLKGEVSLWLVDRAVLALGREQRLDPMPDFLRPANSYFSARDTRSMVFGKIPLRENPGGDEGPSDESADIFDRQTIRRDFRPVPYYEPFLKIDESGSARVRVKLPDNLTDFAIRAKAVSGPGRFGYGKSMISVRLPLIVQPALPRFVRPGDEFQATAVSRIVEGPGGRGIFQMEAEGLEIRGEKRQEIFWSESGIEKLEIPVKVPLSLLQGNEDSNKKDIFVSFAVERSHDGAGDAFEVSLPVREDRSPVHRRVFAILEPGDSLVLPDTEEDHRFESLRRSVLASEEAGMLSLALGLDLLRRDPQFGTPSRIARARADLALKDLRETLHRPKKEESLSQNVENTLEWLSMVVDHRGLIPHWPGGTGSVILTSRAVHFIAEAEDAGFTVNDNLRSTLLRSLENALRSDYPGFIYGEAFTERTLALSGLARAGRMDSAYASELARNAAHLDLESISRVVLALDSANEKEMAGALAQNLWAGVEIRLHLGRERFGGLQPERRRRSPHILPSETRTLAEMVRALGRVDPNHPRLPLLFNGLISLGRKNGWGSADADASALMAITEHLRGKEGTGESISLWLGLNKMSLYLDLSPENPVASMLFHENGPAEIHYPDGTAPVAVLAETSYIPATDGSLTAPENRGFVVSRSMLLVQESKDAPLSENQLLSPGQALEFHAGDIIEEHIRIVNPKDRNYVAVSIPLSAGMEILNPSLATAPMEARTSGRNSHRPTCTEYLDDRVIYFFESMPRGTYNMYFRTHATTVGNFIQPAARAEMIYDPAVYGGSPGARVLVGR